MYALRDVVVAVPAFTFAWSFVPTLAVTVTVYVPVPFAIILLAKLCV